uniref:Tyr recombinase domain-containing protein n=1 Tax=Amphimedon queenslandica TaxID=400682 RepID=A0A1X7VK46_AMPQE
MGHNALAMTVKTLCQSTGASGYYTNHSLHRTCASRLYNKGADEQEIMSITGHRSNNAVRLYKKASLEQEEKLSNMLKSGGAATSDNKVKDDAIVDKIELDTKQPQPGLPVSLPQLPGFTGLSQCTINFSFNNYSNK